ncbi:hypothetical protein RUM44_005324 [Polyplax serrata]|uniref:Uncharacterized protein n=1 Tax=Polyplax serrata TaxID=468196 RepID=A0ABR1ADP0_POLSC
MHVPAVLREQLGAMPEIEITSSGSKKVSGVNLDAFTIETLAPVSIRNLSFLEGFLELGDRTSM